MWYIIIILAANMVIIAANCIFAESALWQSIVAPPLATTAVIAVDGVGAFLIRRMPEKLFSAEKSAAVGEKEKRFYRKLGIKRWKSKVPELGGFTSFHKDRLESRSDREYLARFLLESNYGIVIHIVNAITGFLIMLIPLWHPLAVGLPVAGVNCILSLLPAAILRYNLPGLKRAWSRAK